MQRSSRDLGRTREGLEGWLATRLPDGASPSVAGVEGTSANGMSSDTLLFDASWDEGGGRVERRLVARVAPDPGDVPVFARYDLHRQFEVLRAVAAWSDVPVPAVLWSEPDPAVLGSPFFVMERVDGLVPPDVMPYTFGDNWLYDAEPERQRELQDSTVAVLAGLHDIDDPAGRFGFLAFPDAVGGTPLRRHLAHTRSWYEFVVGEGPPSPLLERAFGWLDEHFPAAEGPAVVSWGDARIGNVIYRDFRPVAVLDWEMAGLGPRELDLAWLLYGHCVFQDIAATFERPGLPEFLRADDVSATYESLTGHTPRRLDWFGTYAAVQWAIVFRRTAQRAVHFGERAAPDDDDVDSLLMNRVQLTQMLEGSYWPERSFG